LAPVAAPGVPAAADEAPAEVPDEAPAAAGRDGRPGPAVQPGLPIGAYTDDQLDDLVAWLRTDGIPRNDEQLAAALRAELGVERRGTRVDAAVGAAVRRAR